MEDVVENVAEGTPEVASELTQEIKQPVVYAAGDLCIKCFKCSATNTLQENIVGGLRFDMYATDQHKIILQCPTCGNRMELFYVESAQTPEVVEEFNADNSTLDDLIPVETEDYEQLVEIFNDEPVLEESQG